MNGLLVDISVLTGQQGPRWHLAYLVSSIAVGVVALAALHRAAHTVGDMYIAHRATVECTRRIRAQGHWMPMPPNAAPRLLGLASLVLAAALTATASVVVSTAATLTEIGVLP